jgi:hypothetical protein
MVGRPCADPEQKQDFGDRTVTQGLDTQRPITEALLWQNLRLQAAKGGKKKRQRATTTTQLTGHPTHAA